MIDQEGDVLHFQTPDEGDIESINGVITMTGSFETAVYHSMFGGNEDDDGTAGNNKAYWGNLLETEPAKKCTSRTQYELERLPLTSGNLSKIEKAAEQDLAWFKDLTIASSVSVVASIVGVNKIKIVVNIIADGEEQQFTFTENWKASK